MKPIKSAWLAISERMKYERHTDLHIHPISKARAHIICLLSTSSLDELWIDGYQLTVLSPLLNMYPSRLISSLASDYTLYISGRMCVGNIEFWLRNILPCTDGGDKMVRSCEWDMASAQQQRHISLQSIGIGIQLQRQRWSHCVFFFFVLYFGVYKSLCIWCIKVAISWCTFSAVVPHYYPFCFLLVVGWLFDFVSCEDGGSRGRREKRRSKIELGEHLAYCPIAFCQNSYFSLFLSFGLCRYLSPMSNYEKRQMLRTAYAIYFVCAHTVLESIYQPAQNGFPCSLLRCFVSWIRGSQLCHLLASFPLCCRTRCTFFESSHTHRLGIGCQCGHCLRRIFSLNESIYCRSCIRAGACACVYYGV